MILGIDPGQTGAVAFLSEYALGDVEAVPESVVDLPIVNGIVNVAGLYRMFQKISIRHAYVERAQSMSKQGIASTFKYGVGYGAILGVLAALQIPYTLVSPQVWKKAFHLIGKDKEASRALAIQWYPQAELHLKKHHGRAEALLIARWGMTQ